MAESGDLKKRTLSGAVVVLAGAAVIYLSSFPEVFSVCMALISGMCTFELVRAALPEGYARPAYRDPFTLTVCICTAAIAFIPAALNASGTDSGSGYALFCALLLSAAFLLFAVVAAGPFFSALKGILPAVLLSAVFAALALSAQYLRRMEHGLFLLILGVCIPESCDIFAYLAGRKFGRRKLAPKISPGKTVEGFVGGVLLSAVCCFAGAVIAGAARGNILRSYPFLILTVISAALAGQFSDLALSCVKRADSVKDFGKLIPGHGGLMDRLDSLVLSLPLFYLLCAANSSLIFR